MAELVDPQGTAADAVEAVVAGHGHSARDVLPSAREVELGLEVPEHLPPPESSPTPAASSSRAPLHVRLRDAGRTYLIGANPRAIEGPQLPLVVLALTYMLGGWDDTALGLLLPEMRNEFGLSMTFLTTITVVMGNMLDLIGPAFGYAADRVKRVWMVRVGRILSNVATIAQGVAPGVGAFAGAKVVQGIGGGIAGPAEGPLIADYYPPTSRARVYAFLGIAATVGGIAGTLLAGNLAEWIGWRPTVVVLGILGSVIALGTFLLREPKRGFWDRKAMGASDEVAQREQEPVSWGEAWRAAGAITTVRRLWYATPFLTLGSTGIGIILIQYYSSEFNLGPSARANIAVIGASIGLLGLVFGGAFADRYLTIKPSRVIHVIAGLTALNALNVLVLVVSRNLTLSIVFSIPSMFLGAMVGPALLTLFSVTIPARLRGLGMQTFAPWRVLGRSALPFVGILIDTSSLRTGLLAFIPMTLIGAGLIWSVAWGLHRDIRNAMASSMADEEAARARVAGRGKMVIARDVDVHYDDVQILFNVDLDVMEGEILALLGTNGAGKSTLLRALSGLTEPSAGAIFIDGRDTTHLPPHELAALGVAQMPGGHAVFPALTVEENLRAAAWLVRREDSDAVEAEITRLVTELFPSLRERLTQPAGTLSGGEQQMVGIAQAFLMRPRLLMIDELSLGLAPGVVRQLLSALRELRARGTTIIIVEQSVNLALTIADRAVFMEKGEVRFTGPAAELLQRRDLVRSVYLRNPGANKAHRTVTHQRDTEARPGDAILAAEDVTVTFGGVAALRGASIAISHGEIVGIIGPNGAGKTTLFDVISGFVVPDTGRVRIGREDVTSLTPDQRAQRGLARSFQDSRLFPAMTVRENIMVGLERHLGSRSAVLSAAWAPAARRADARARRRAETLIDLLGVGDYRDKLVGDLSTGVRRLVDLAVQLAADPEVLLLDEPSSGIAQAETVELGPLLQRVRREADCALLVIEHDIDLISSISDRIVAMDLGAAIVEGRPADVFADERVVAAYLGGAEDELPARRDPEGQL